MKKLIISYLFLNFCYFAFCQENIFTGLVIDSVSKNPIEFANIEVFKKKTGCAADENGKYSLRTEKIDIQDTLFISALGYQTLKVPFSELNKQIKLSRKIYELEEVTISSTIEYITKGNTSKKPKLRWYVRKPGDEIRYYISATKGKKELIENISVFIAENKISSNKIKDYGLLNRPFRIRLYRVETVSGEKRKGDDIIDKSIIVNPDLKEEGWCNIDISKHKIFIPENGIFVAVEMINYSSIEKKDGMFIGLSKNKKKEPNTWLHLIGFKQDVCEEEKDAMISLKVKVL